VRDLIHVQAGSEQHGDLIANIGHEQMFP
jgi:hypothetical protein